MRKVLLGITTIVVTVIAWHLAVIATATKIFPSPAAVVTAVGDLVEGGLLFAYIRDSLFRVACGYLAGALIGVPFGIFLGYRPGVARAVNPLIQILRPISPIAWMPLAVIWFGVSNAAPIFLIFLASFFPIVVGAMNGVRNVPPMYMQAGVNFGLTPFQMMRRIVVPAVLPRIAVALRVAFGVAWVVLVAAEMIAVNSGLGYLIIDARNAGKRYDLVVAGILMIGLLGLILDTMFRRVEKFAIERR